MFDYKANNLRSELTIFEYVVTYGDENYADEVNKLLEYIPHTADYIQLLLQGQISLDRYYQLFPYDCFLGIDLGGFVIYVNIYNIDKLVAQNLRTYIITYFKKNSLNIPVAHNSKAVHDSVYFVAYDTYVRNGVNPDTAVKLAATQQSSARFERVKTGKISIPRRTKWFQ